MEIANAGSHAHLSTPMHCMGDGVEDDDDDDGDDDDEHDDKDDDDGADARKDKNKSAPTHNLDVCHTQHLQVEPIPERASESPFATLPFVIN